MANPETESSTSNTSGDEFQVFLSFRGPDTRCGFTDVLHRDLVDAGIRVFIDNENLRQGEKISGELLQAIDNSKLYIPIFSKKYASSHWCLRELAKMVKNTSNSKEDDGIGKAILPIFYHVKPDDVKLKTRLYTEAISELKQKREDHKKKFSSKEIKAWQRALKEVGGIAGWELKKSQGYMTLIQAVVHNVVVRLRTRRRQVTEHLYKAPCIVFSVSGISLNAPLPPPPPAAPPPPPPPQPPMDARRRPAKPLHGPVHPRSKQHRADVGVAGDASSLKASDALPLPLYLANAVFFTLFFSVVYYLLSRWREKIRTSTPLHLVTPAEMAAIVAFVASFIYLVGFFGVDFVQSLILRPAGDVWTADDEDDDVVVAGADHDKILLKEDSRSSPCGQALDCAPVVQKPKLVDPVVQDAPKEKVIEAVPSAMPEEDEEIIKSVVEGKMPSYSLEAKLGDCKRAAAIRREALQRITGKSLSGLPLEGFDYESILGQCCEMPVGYVQIPVGIAGPLLLDGREYSVPMATTEGCLVASTNRGCKAIFVSGGATSVLLRDGMTRAPIVRFATAKRAADLKFFVENPANFESLAVIFNRSSRFARLQSIKCAIAGKNLYMRFSCSTGDAMGMNMVSKGVQNVLDFLQSDFPDMDVLGISGNFCADKKPAAVNWIEGRGKSVVCEATIKGDVVRKVLKTSVEALVELNMLKNLTGSAMAGALGGFNAHASNIVAAIFIATGQDPAQNVESSHCITMMEALNDGKDLHVSVTMPSIEVGTVGGGTQLASQSACLNLLGVKGANKELAGANSRLLATVVSGAVLAAELSLMSAIAAGQLVRSHMKYNRSSKDVTKVSS